MSKIYIFGIGGTGSRVIKSLTMLLASGVQMDSDAIVPIIIDPDVAAADLTRTVDLIHTFNNIRGKLTFTTDTQCDFFRTEIRELLPGFRMNLENTQNLRFKEYIQLSTMDRANQAFAKILFSDDNLNSDMEVGFKGNPNIGSVVLNRFTQSVQFLDFASDFQGGDKIFIISSIFGGTGASGFPVLLKNLRTLLQKDSQFPNGKEIQDCVIGAISVLPYFGVKPKDESAIDQATFISKTKAALTYYNQNMSTIDLLYYLADDIKNKYENNEGGENQKNDAHLMELAAALAIVDFDKSIKERSPQTIYREFGVKSNSENLTLPDLCDMTYDTIAKPLTQFTLFCKFINEQLSDSIRQKLPWTVRFNEKKWFADRYAKSYINRFVAEYVTWLTEMQNNKRGFAPFELGENRNAVFSLVKGCETKKVLFRVDSNYALFDGYLNKKEKKFKEGLSLEQRFMELFYTVTEELINDKIRL